MGTPGFAAPEQYGREQTDPRSRLSGMKFALFPSMRTASTVCGGPVWKPCAAALPSWWTRWTVPTTCSSAAPVQPYALVRANHPGSRPRGRAARRVNLR